MRLPTSIELSRGLLLAATLPVAASAAQVEAVSPQAAPTQATCQSRANDTLNKLLVCIRQPWLWSRLSAFQDIAKQNLDAAGHPNRNTGAPGYKASVDYVAALMRQAGYAVTVQSYTYSTAVLSGTPRFEAAGTPYEWKHDWFVARLSGGGSVAAAIRRPGGSGTGCAAGEFTRFPAGSIALVERGACGYDVQVEHAADAGASAVILYNQADRRLTPDTVRMTASRGADDGSAFEAKLTRAAPIPVLGVVSHAIGDQLRLRIDQGAAPVARIDVPTTMTTGTDYNLIADSPYGNPDQTVVVDAHLDAIFGEGMLDNASGSATIAEIALSLAHTPTRNRLRYIWFGGEELGLLGSKYYTQHLSAAERAKLVFDVDVDVTATPNFDYLVADPANAPNVGRFPAGTVTASQIGNRYFADYFTSISTPSRKAWFGNQGTDSNSFALIGIPDTGILTMQDCCKQPWEVSIWGGTTGNYEGHVPGTDGGCVDNPNRWCDNLANNDPTVLATASKATAYVVFQLANRVFAAASR